MNPSPLAPARPKVTPVRVLAVTVVLLAGLVGSSRPAMATEGADEATLAGTTNVSTGYSHSCARLANGQARCWGENSYGVLGTGNNTDSHTATTVLNPAGSGPLANVTQLVNGDYGSCALLVSQEVRCWGDDGNGQVGNGAAGDSLLPVPVLNPMGTGRLTGVTQITAGQQHVCARLATGQARCWGYNGDGQLGNDSGANGTRPVVVQNVAGTGPLTGVTQIDAGDYHTCARLSTGQARCWGRNQHGQLGNGTTDDADLPVVVRSVSGPGALTGVTQISAGGGRHSCAVLDNGQARCWGDNLQGQLGTGDIAPRTRPANVDNATGTGRLTGVSRIEAGYGHTCARLSSPAGQVRCWGSNNNGELGIGTMGSANATRPVTVENVAGSAALTGVTRLALNSFHTCVRLGNGQARCWGYGADGQIGDGDTEDRPRPVVVQD